jgi:multiple sugar transport system ATP-binding protein
MVSVDGRSLAGVVGQPVTLGIRPEDIRPVGSASEADMQATVAIVERLGAETYLNVRNGDDTLLVRAQGDLAMKPGESVQLAMNHAAFHLFDQSNTIIAA